MNGVSKSPLKVAVVVVSSTLCIGGSLSYTLGPLPLSLGPIRKPTDPHATIWPYKPLGSSVAGFVHTPRYRGSRKRLKPLYDLLSGLERLGVLWPQNCHNLPTETGVT